MSSVIFNMKKESLSKYCLHNTLIYIVITPPRWRFEIDPLVVNGQQTTDNSLRVLRLLLKRLYSKFNLQKSYLTNFYKVCSHALRLAIDNVQLTIDNYKLIPIAYGKILTLK